MFFFLNKSSRFCWFECFHLAWIWIITSMILLSGRLASRSSLICHSFIIFLSKVSDPDITCLRVSSSSWLSRLLRRCRCIRLRFLSLPALLLRVLGGFLQSVKLRTSPPEDDEVSSVVDVWFVSPPDGSTSVAWSSLRLLNAWESGLFERLSKSVFDVCFSHLESIYFSIIIKFGAGWSLLNQNARVGPFLKSKSKFQTCGQNLAVPL